MSGFFTDKQAEFIKKVKYGGLKRLNILTGSVRAGKTWVTLVGWALWVAQMPIDKDYIPSDLVVINEPTGIKVSEYQNMLVKRVYDAVH